MYRYWFDNIKGITPVKKRILYETFDNVFSIVESFI